MQATRGRALAERDASDLLPEGWSNFSRPGEPTDNAFIERLNRKLRAECLNADWFLSLHEARRKSEARRRDYNEVRPHSAIGAQVPAALHRSAGNPGRPAARRSP